jgi:hypothetical protein
MSGILVFILRVLLALFLYGFLAFAMITIWREIRLQSHALNRPGFPLLSLKNLEKADKAPLSFNTSEIILGRDPACEYPLPDEAVSNRHARFSYHHKQWWLEDLGSTNGTFLNTEKLVTAAVVESGDMIRVGSLELEIILASEA